jgi:uncharacterized protein YqjF (DUF2071 family)
MWVMGQTWRDLLFAHWPLDRATIEPHVPEALSLDEYDGQAWLGISPFVVSSLRLAATPPLPVVSTFPELNVRTYVTHGEKPGIWFFSLDAASRLAVAGARRFFKLPYFRARMEAKPEVGSIDYTSERHDRRGQDACFRAHYGPVSEPFAAAPGSLEHFLTERYCLYSRTAQEQLLRAEIIIDLGPSRKPNARSRSTRCPHLPSNFPTKHRFSTTRPART